MKNSITLFLLSFFTFVSYSQEQNLYSIPQNQSLRNKLLDKEQGNVNINHSASTRNCQTMEVDSIIRNRYPQLGNIQDFENKLKIEITKQSRKNARTQNVIYTIPVIVHVVHNGQSLGVEENITSAQVQSQIEVLNEDFRRKAGTPGYNNNLVGADVEIEFALALYDPYGKLLSEPGIHRVNGGRTSWDSFDDIDQILKPQTIWNPDMYFNIWTVKYGGSMSNNLGFAQFPNLSGLIGLPTNSGFATTDGVVCRYSAFGRVGTLERPFNMGRTISHEVGHWLGLRHIWGDVINQCNHPQDYCDDTPKARDKNYGCPLGKNSCIFYFGSGDGPDMIENYMDYTDDACMNIFTQNQKTRMRTVMEVSPRRKELLNSKVHISSNKPFAFFESNKRTVCSGSTITFSDSSKNTPTSWQWDIYNTTGTNLGTFNTKNISIIFNSAGVYDIRLIVANTAGKDTLYKSCYVTVLSSSEMSFPFNETVEGYPTFLNWIFYNPDKDKAWSETNKASAFGNGNWSLVFDNYDPSIDLGGKVDAIFTNKLNLSTNQNVVLSFDVAYAQYNQKYNDTLVLYYSINCGQTFIPFWSKGGNVLATAPSTTSAFTPSNSQWRTENISLKFLEGNPSVYIAFVNRSGWGNKLYLDNLKLIIPNIIQKPIVLFNASNPTVCEGETVQFNDLSLSYPTSWAWEFSNGTPTTSSLQNPKVRYDVSGMYNVKLTGSNRFGADNWLRTNYITVLGKPNITISSDNLSICSGDSIKLKASGGTSYNWYDERDNKIGVGDSIWLYPTQTSLFKVIGENNFGCKNLNTKSIQVNQIPSKPIIVQFGNMLSTSSLSGNYQWYSNSGIINGATNKDYTPTTNGIYYVVITNSNNCAVRSDNFNFTITSYELFKEDIVNKNLIYPNPAKEEFQVLTPYNSENLIFNITNHLGQQFKAKSTQLTSNGNTSINVSNLPNGLYYLQLKIDGSLTTYKFIKLD